MNYAELTKVQKMAAFLITIGPKAASEVMKSFEEAQLEPLCREMMAMPLIPTNIQSLVLKEFSSVIEEGTNSTLGGIGFTQAALELAKGDYTASAIINRCEPANRGGANEQIRTMDGSMVLNLVRCEQPQTIAFIVSCMEVAKGAEIVALLKPTLQEEVLERLGLMEATTRESIQTVAKNLNRHIGQSNNTQGLHRGGGISTCVKILNTLDKETRKSLLTRMDERNETLGTAIRKKVFSFEDLARLSVIDLQRILRDVNSTCLPPALKTARPSVTEAVLSALSKRAAAQLKEDIELLGPQRAKDIEAAQDEICAVVRALDEAEQITLDNGGPENAFL